MSHAGGTPAVSGREDVKGPMICADAASLERAAEDAKVVAVSRSGVAVDTCQ
jgi:hypothetical protein